jgi:outer membrane protein OmpA-like peptidoglycan-associated protein
MNTLMNQLKKPLAVAITIIVMTACATTSKAPDGSVAVRQKLTQLQADPQLATRAPVAIKIAEDAVREAEKPTSDKAESKHLVLMADRKIDTAFGLAQKRLLEDQRKTLDEDSANARLDSRTREADQAHSDAAAARNDADSARIDAELAKQKADELQRQIAELNAKETDRGLVVTLGDLLFDTGRAELKGGADAHLAKLATFLNKYPDRTIIIEGHTDSVGADDYNLGLSQRRADSVKGFLLAQGIAVTRLASAGKGENFPVASNDSASGRQQNRRVEVIIANAMTVTK